MRVTIDLPEALYRQVEARAALERRPVKSLVRELLQHALAASEAPAATAGRARSLPPTVAVSGPFPLPHPTNATLFEWLDDPLRPHQTASQRA